MKTSPRWLQDLNATADWSQTQPAASLVRLVDYPVALGVRQYEDSLDLLREFQLIDLDRTSPTTNAAQDLVALAADLTHRFGPMISAINETRDRAYRAGQEYIVLEYPTFPEIRQLAIEYARVMGHADEYCRSGALMHLESAPEIQALRRWTIEEIVMQYEGRPPRPWTVTASEYLAATALSAD